MLCETFPLVLFEIKMLCETLSEVVSDKLVETSRELLTGPLVLVEIRILCDVLSDVVSDRFDEMSVELLKPADTDADRVVEAAELSGMLLMLDTRLLSINRSMSPSWSSLAWFPM